MSLSVHAFSFSRSLQLLLFFIYDCRSTVVPSSTATPNMQPNLISFENHKIPEGSYKNYRVTGTISGNLMKASRPPPKVPTGLDILWFNQVLLFSAFTCVIFHMHISC